jgi:AMP-polyphosphate phosphotransferase
VYEKMLAATNTDVAPWHIVPMEDKRTGIERVFQVLITALEEALKDRQRPMDPEKGPVKDLSIPNILSPVQSGPAHG